MRSYSYQYFYGIRNGLEFYSRLCVLSVKINGSHDNLAHARDRSPRPNATIVSNSKSGVVSVGRQKQVRNTRGRLVTLLSVWSPFARPEGPWFIRWGDEDTC
jgi:hypothetical protein